MIWKNVSWPKNDVFVALDFETTGLNPENGDRVVQVGAVKKKIGADHGNGFEKINFWVNPQGKKLDPKAAEVNGITDEQLKDVPITWDKGMGKKLLEFTDGAFILAHRLFFEKKFWECENSKAGLPIREYSAMCTKAFYASVMAETSPTGYVSSGESGLGNAYTHLGYRIENYEHDAAYDAYLSIRVFESLLRKMNYDWERCVNLFDEWRFHDGRNPGLPPDETRMSCTIGRSLTDPEVRFYQEVECV